MSTTFYVKVQEGNKSHYYVSISKGQITRNTHMDTTMGLRSRKDTLRLIGKAMCTLNPKTHKYTLVVREYNIIPHNK